MAGTITLRAAPVFATAAILVAAIALAVAFGLVEGLARAALASGVAAAALAWILIESRARRRRAERQEDAIEKLASQLERASAHLATLDDRIRDVEQWIASDARPGVEQSAAEIEILGTLVKELAVAVAHHDAELGAVAPAPATPAPQASRTAQHASAHASMTAPPISQASPSFASRSSYGLAPAYAPPSGAPPNPAPGAPQSAAPSAPFQAAISDPASADAQRVATAIDRAIADGEFELHLQPVVSLPQRRVKFYEAFARLRSVDGELVPYEHGLMLANASGRRAALDIAALRRVALATRKLIARNRDISVFLRISDKTLVDRERLASVLHGVQDLSGHIVVVLSQTAVRTLGAGGLKKLQPLLDLGFTFGMDEVSDLRLDPRLLFDHGVRYVKTSTAVLMADARRAPSEIHPQDLSRLLARNGIQLIAADIDLEKTVIEALDLDVRFGQGAAFSPPRPVRPDLFEPAPPPEPVTPSAPAANDAPQPPQRVPYRSTLRRA